MDQENEHKLWENMWKEDKWKYWHLNERNPDLCKYIHLLCPEERDKSGIFLVPMCGKSLDLKFLYEAGFYVVGVELCENIVEEFFTENGFTFEIIRYSDKHKIYTTPDSRLRVICGDILDLEKDVLRGTPVKMVWDRAAMGSIKKEFKKKYVRTIQSLLQDHPVRYLLQCWEYKDWYRSGPPHSCPTAMIHDLYGENFDIQELDSSHLLERGTFWGDPGAHRKNYFLATKKKSTNA